MAALPQCLEWISKLLPDIEEEDALKLLGVQAAVFAAPGPAAEDVVVPDWVGQQFVWERTIPVLPNTTLELPSSVYYPLLERLLASPGMEAGKGFAEYVVRQLGGRREPCASRSEASSVRSVSWRARDVRREQLVLAVASSVPSGSSVATGREDWA